MRRPDWDGAVDARILGLRRKCQTISARGPHRAPVATPDLQCNNGVKLALLNETRQSDDELRPLARQHVQRRAQAYPLTHCFAHAGLSVT
jgi:hypothetical protein